MPELKYFLFFLTLTFTYAEELDSSAANIFTGSAAKLFVAESSGRFENEPNLEHLKEEGYITKQNLVTTETYPLKNNPALNSDFTLYFVASTPEKIMRQQILAVKGEGDVFEVQPYDFVHPESFENASFELSSLESLTLNDLKFREECKVFFVRTGETTIAADWPICEDDDSTIVRVMFSFNCDSWTGFVYNKNLKLSSSKIPYTAIKVESFPVPASIMPDYEIYKSLCNY